MGIKKDLIIAFATSRAHPEGTADDHLAMAALRELNVAVQTPVWDDASVNWKSFDAVIVRSTWDYTSRISEFLGWVARLELSGVKLFNPAPVLFWNSSKTYLRELESAGIPIVPTAWLKAGGTAEMLRELGEMISRGSAGKAWEKFILKPAVSAGGVRTYRFGREDLGARGPRRAELESALLEYEPGSMILVQPFLEEVVNEGEWAFLFFNGVLSHSILKRAADGEFRIQQHYGGRNLLSPPPEGALESAEAVLREARRLRGCDLLYARVDMIRTSQGWLLGELEAIEPALFFEDDPSAADRFAGAVVSAVNADAVLSQ